MEISQHSGEYNHNNIDLIRLFAAIQVAHFHIFYIMGIRVTDLHAKITSFLGLFPGVPIFFFISGFLISKSWERHPNLKNYAANRFLRIYPGLICTVTLSFILIHASGYVGLVDPGFGELVLLFFAKTTILQFYNPDFMRGYGDGVMNGSLWTITVELQFYVLMPLCYAVLKRLKGIDYNRAIVFLIWGFLAINVTYNHLYGKYSQNVIFKLFGVSFLPWFYMFLLGAFFQRKFDLFYHLLNGRFILCFFVYVCIAAILRQFGAEFGNSLNPLIYFLLACVLFTAAYSYKSLSEKILRGTDISYGIYLYHMPFVNVMIFMSGSKSYIAALAVAGAIISISFASWFLVERRALKFKPNSLKVARC